MGRVIVVAEEVCEGKWRAFSPQIIAPEDLFLQSEMIAYGVAYGKSAEDAFETYKRFVDEEGWEFYPLASDNEFVRGTDLFGTAIIVRRPAASKCHYYGYNPAYRVYAQGATVVRVVEEIQEQIEKLEKVCPAIWFVERCRLFAFTSDRVVDD